MASMADARPTSSRKSGYMSPGARKEKLRERSYARPRRGRPRNRPGSRRAASPPKANG